MNNSREIILERLKNNTNETSHIKVNVAKKTYHWSKEEMIANMEAGSIIYDLAAVQGGNTAHIKVDEIIDKINKVKQETNIKQQ